MKVSSINYKLNYSKPVFCQDSRPKKNISSGSEFLERSADICFCSGIVLALIGGDSIAKKIKETSAVTKIGIGALIASGILVLSNIIYKIANNK